MGALKNTDFEYITISVQFHWVDIFAKQNRGLKHKDFAGSVLSVSDWFENTPN